MAESTRIDGLGLEELKSLLVQVLEDNARLKAEVAALRDENARLKGRPKIAPSGVGHDHAKQRGGKKERLRRP